jgi:DNA-directed RNA polymerase specialized sigma24 family protein
MPLHTAQWRGAHFHLAEPSDELVRYEKAKGRGAYAAKHCPVRRLVCLWAPDTYDRGPLALEILIMTPSTLQPAAKNERAIRAEHLPESSAGSVTKLIGRVKEGDEAAIYGLYDRYARRVIGLARRQLRGRYLRVADEHDVANSVFNGFFVGAGRGQYAQLQDREDLWHLLFVITIRKTQKLVNWAERGKRVPPEGRQDPDPDAQYSDHRTGRRNPPPDEEALIHETIERLLNCLDGKGPLRFIAIRRWEGYSNEEIATMLGCSSRAILRKLKLIRTIWLEELASDQLPCAKAARQKRYSRRTRRHRGTGNGHAPSA